MTIRGPPLHEETGSLDQVTFREVLAIREFRVLWIAQAQSRMGDQLARSAMALLVFDRTSSAGLTAVVYALTYLPPLITAPFLAGFADRYSRRAVMTVVDLLRAGLMALMTIPGMPLPIVVMLLVVLACPQPLFLAARNATLPAVLPGDRLAIGTSIVSTTDYLSQTVGLILGGLLTELLGGPNTALGIDAATFLISAGLVRWGLGPHRPSPDGSSPAGAVRFALAGIGALRRDRRLIGLAGLTWLFGLYLAPTALAAPYAREIGAGNAFVGVLMAANLPGAVLGTLVLARLTPPLRQRLTVPLALFTGLPLLVTAATPSLPVTVVLWALCGVGSSYIVTAQVAFSRTIPDAFRARALGILAAGLQTAQGLGVLLAGAIAEVVPPSSAIALCAAAGSLGAVGIAVRPTGLHEARSGSCR